MLKKIFFVTVLAASVLSSANESIAKSEILGTWRLVKESMTEDDRPHSYIGDIFFVFKNDGTMIQEVYGNETVRKYRIQNGTLMVLGSKYVDWNVLKKGKNELVLKTALEEVLYLERAQSSR